MKQIQSESENGSKTLKKPTPLISGYIVAVVSVGVMTCLRLSLNTWLEGQSRFILLLGLALYVMAGLMILYVNEVPGDEYAHSVR